MSEPEYIIEVPGLINNTVRKKIIFTKEGFAVQKRNGAVPSTFIHAENLVGFRYSANWITGYVFNFGRQYVIQVIDNQNKIFTIKLSSLYSVRREAYHKIWSDMINQLWRNYFVNNFNYYYDLYTIRQEFELGDVKFHPFGISWYDGSMFWEEIALSNYKTYFMIHHREDVKKTKHCSFKNDWNALILQSLLKKIIQEQNAYRNRTI